MYSPYPATVVFALIQLALFMVATGMQSCNIIKTTKVIYYIVMVILVLMDVLLLFSVTMGVGASGYNANTKNCYLLEWFYILKQLQGILSSELKGRKGCRQMLSLDMRSKRGLSAQKNCYPAVFDFGGVGPIFSRRQLRGRRGRERVYCLLFFLI